MASLLKKLAAGKGVIRRKGMEGSSLFLVITPVISNGKIVELKGTFSGIAKAGINQFQKGRFINVKNGRFRVSVRGKQ